MLRSSWWHNGLFLVLVAMGTLTITMVGGAQGRLLFSDDFADAPVGGFPPGWRISARGDYLQVVNDPTAKGGRAVRILGDPSRASSMVVELSTEDPVIVIEHSVRWVKNSGLNYYVYGQPSGNNVNWFVDQRGHLNYRFTQNGKVTTAQAGLLNPGWNRVRVQADYERNEVYLYLNDLEIPALGPLPFRTPVDDWRVIRLTFYDTGRKANVSELTESYYDDVRVWSLSREEVEGADSAEPVQAISARSTIWAGDLPPRAKVVPPLPSEPPEASVERVRVPLTVTEDSGVRRIGQPVSSGIPLPRGQLWDDAGLRLLNADGVEVPLQTEVLARWPDDSIRWVLLIFQADLLPRERARFNAEYGSAVERAQRRGLQLHRDGNSLQVAAGALKWSLPSEGVTAAVDRAGEEWRWVGVPTLTARDKDGFVYTSAGTSYAVDVEEDGPQRAVVRIRGELRAESPGAPGLFAFEYRLFFFRDRAVVRIDPVLTNLMAHAGAGSEVIELHEVSLVFPKWLSGQDALAYELGLLSPSDAGAQHLIGMASEATSGVPERITGKTFGGFRLAQEDVGLLRMADQPEDIMLSKRSSGWIHFTRGERQVGVGVRHFWEQFSKGFEVTPAGDLCIHLWVDGSLTMRGGEAKRHEVYVSLEDEPNMAAWLQPLMAVASPEWYSDTEGMGQPIFVYDPELLPLLDPSVAAYEEFVQEGFVQLLRNREVLKEYGWRHFGDWSTTWDPDGWGNIECDLARAFFLQFARTGELEYLRFAETAARHWMDLDIIWAADTLSWLGGGIEHSTAHRSKTVDTGHTWLQGLVDYYLFTGDRRSLEAALLTGDWFARMALERPASGPRLHNRPGARRPGWALIALMRLAHLGDPYYLEAAQALVQIMAEEQTADGQWTYGIPEAELPGEGRPQLTKGFMTALTLKGLVDYERFTGDPLAADLLVKGTRFLVDEMWDYDVGGFQYIHHPKFPPSVGSGTFLFLDSLVRTYQLTKDERFLHVARRAFEAAVAKLKVSESNFGKSIAQAIRQTPESMVGFVAEPLPYVVRAPEELQLYKGSPVTLEVTFTRRDAEEGYRGSVRVLGTPEGLSMEETELPFELRPGERSAVLRFNAVVGDTLYPGTYSMQFQEIVTRVSACSAVRVRGWRRLDAFRPPVEHGWFGSFSFSATLEESAGWTYATDSQDAPYGLVNRRVRQGSGEEYLVYEVPGLYSFQLVALVPHEEVEGLGECLQIWIGNQGEEWSRVGVDVAWEASEGMPLAKVTLSPSTRLRGDRSLLKIVVAGAGASRWPQLGELQLEGWDLNS